MPFTLAHPALVLPLNYLTAKRVSLTGLVIGSMAPDLQTFIFLGSDKSITHNWLGIIWFCLPVSLLLSFVYHLAVREMLILHLPKSLQLRFILLKDFNWVKRFRENSPLVIISILAGAALHLCWDSFSHFDGYFIRNNEALQGNMQIGERSVEIPFVIQYVNSLIGLGTIVVAVLRLPKARNVRIRVVILKYWIIVATITAAISFLTLLTLEKKGIEELIIAVTRAFALALLVTSILFSGGTIKDRWGSGTGRSRA